LLFKFFRFGSDICTCRPYLVYALQECIQCAQRGGVGLVVYYRKEGRSLGEVVKFRVYNARENQAGGDNAATYFNKTERIAGERYTLYFILYRGHILYKRSCVFLPTPQAVFKVVEPHCLASC